MCNRPSSPEVKTRGTVPPLRLMSSRNSVSLQGKLYLYVGEEGARPSKNLEVFCSGEDFVMMTVITPLPPELNAQCNV